MYKIVLDTNVLVSGSLIPKGKSAFILDSWRNGYIQIVTSLEILEEFEHVMKNKFNAPSDEIETVKAFLIWKGIIVEPKQKIDMIKEDPDDNKVLEVAIEGNVDYIVSGDKDLTRIGVFQGIRIVTPDEMGEIIRFNISHR
jgi:hypothetical protein